MANHLETYKIALINISVFLISFSNIEHILKIILLLVSIVYTSFKIIEIIKKKDK